jgi:hypothetical protein
VAKGQTVTLGRMWSDVSAVTPVRSKRVRVLSIDGAQLNTLILTDGLAPGDQIFRPASREQPTPTVRAGMSATERMEFVVDNVAVMGYQRVESAKPRPAKFGEAPALRFDLTAATSAGLEIQGSALVAESGGKLYVILYLAPTEHYYQAGLPEIEAIMASARPNA